MFRNFSRSSARRVNRKAARKAWGKGTTIRRSRLTGMELMEERRVLAVSNFAEAFDGVVAPALPAGWVTSGTVAWTTSTAQAVTPLNSAFVSEPTFVSDNAFDSPVIAVVRPQAQLTFQNRFDLEDGFDGGVLEIKIGAGAFTDIVTAGGSFVSGGYTDTLNAGSNPLAGQQAWSGNSGGFITTTVNLPASAAGQNVQFRWREVTDGSLTSNGWFIDNVQLTGVLPAGGAVVIDANDDPAAGSQAADGNADTFSVVVTPTNVQVSVNGTLVFNSPTASVTSLTINGSSDNDTVNVDGNDNLVTFPFTASAGGGTDAFDMDEWNVQGAGNDGAVVIAFDTVNIDGSTFSGNGSDGIQISQPGSVDITDSVASNNAAHGFNIIGAGAVTMSGITATGNDPGILVTGAASYSLSDSTVSNNDDHGISLQDITGDVTLIRVTANNNDADNNSDGDGFQVLDSALDGDTIAMGGNLLVRGSTFRDTDGPAAGVHQENGVYIQNVSGTVTFNDEAGGASNNISDNEEIGVWIDDGGTTATFTNGTYSNNGLSGIRLDSFSGAVSLTGVTASNNGLLDNGSSGVRVVEGAGSFSDTGGIYRTNPNNGIFLDDTIGAVTLVRTTAEDNNRNNDAFGFGVEIDTTIASLLVQGGNFNDTTGAGGATHQAIGIQVDAVTGTVTFQDSAGPVQSVTVNGNEGDGVRITDGGTTATFTNGNYNNNVGDGIDIASFSGAVTMTGGQSNGNDPGTVVNGAASYSATDWTFSNNDQHGLLLIDIAGNVTLTRVTANDNDFDGTNDGDGVHAQDGGDGDTVAIGGNLIVNGGSFSDTGGAGTQDNGIVITSITGSATFQNDAVVGPLQSVNASGNSLDGVRIDDGGTDATFTNGTYNGNNDDGIDLNSFSGTVTLSFVTANNNTDFGFEISNVVNGGNTGTVNLSDLTLTGNNGGGVGPGGDLNTIDIVNYTTSTVGAVNDTLVVEQTFIERTVPAQQRITYTAVEVMNLSTHDGNDTINVNGTGATVSTTVNGNNGNDIVNINASNLASPSNTFNGNANDDTFNVNITNGAAVSAPISIHGNANDFGGGVGSRDVVIINDNVPLGPIAVTFTYTGNAGDSELTVASAAFVNTITVDTVETVRYNDGGANNDTATVLGTAAGTDLITVAPIGVNRALVFNNSPTDASGPFNGPPEDWATRIPGVSGGSVRPDLDLNGIANTGLTVRDTTVGADDRLYIYGQSTLGLNDGNTFNPFGFGNGQILPAVAEPASFDVINVSDTLTTIDNLVQVNYNATDFVQAVPNVDPAIVINSGFEGNPPLTPGTDVADDISLNLSTTYKFQINGGDPDPATTNIIPPDGDRLNVLTAVPVINVFSNKNPGGAPVVTIEFPGSGFLPFSFSSIENFGAYQATTVNLIGDNNDVDVDQTDNFVVVGTGINAFDLYINGSIAIPFSNVLYLNVYGFDQQPESGGNDNPVTATTADDIDTLEITAYADNSNADGDAPTGWGIDVFFNEGVPEQADGNQQDLIIYHTSQGLGGGGSVSENIVIVPSGPDNGEIRVTNAADGSVIVILQYTNNTDIVVLDDDGSVNDTDSLTLRGTDPMTGQTTGTERFEVDFDAAGDVANPFVTVYDTLGTAATGDDLILYRLRTTWIQSVVALDLTDAASSGGAFYTDGVYLNVPLTSTNGAGTGATANITVNGGVVTNVQLVDGGSGYVVGEILTAADADLGAGGGAGFLIAVTAISAPFATVNFEMLGGNDVMNYLSPIDTTFTSGVDGVNVYGGGGDDTLNVNMDGRSAQDDIGGRLLFDGGTGRDLLTFAGDTDDGITTVTYNPGPIPGNGQVLHASNGTTQVTDFVNIEPVIDTTVAATLIVNGTNANNAINYSQDPADAARGLITIDEQESISFNNKTELEINGLAGDDVIHVNSGFTPTGLADIDVDGGDPTASDTVIVSGTTLADTFDIEIETQHSAEVTVNGGVLMEIFNAELLKIDGKIVDNDTGDTINYLAIDGGENRIVFTPGAVADAGLITGFDFFGSQPSHLPVSFTNVGADATLNFNANSGEEENVLVILGTIGNDTVTVAGTSGNIQLTTPTGGAHKLITATGFPTLELDTFAGDDTITLNAVLPYAETIVNAGEPSASDVLNLVGTAGAEAVVVDLALQVITGFGGAVGYTGVEHVNLAGNGGADTLTVNGTEVDDILTYEPTEANDGKFQLTGQNTAFTFDEFTGTFTVNLLGDAADEVIVLGTNSRDLITVDATARTVTVDPANVAGTLKTVTLGATVETLTVQARNGSDTIWVLNPAAGVGGIDNLLIFVDGGNNTVADALVVGNSNGAGGVTNLAATDFAVVARSAEANSGLIRIYRDAAGAGNEPTQLPDISYVNVETVSPNVFVSAGGIANELVLGADIYEPNQFRNIAEYLGTGATLNVQNLGIFPNATEFPGVPADVDFFRVVAQKSGTLDIQLYFFQVAELLPANGNLSLDVLDVNGNVIAGFGSNDADDNERVRIPAVAGQTYYIRVQGATTGAVNGYDFSVINTAAPVPFDIELLDNPVNTNTNPVNGAPGATAAGLSSDTGRSQFDNTTFDNDPTILIRVPDVLVNPAGFPAGTYLSDIPFNGSAPGSAPDEEILIPHVASTALDAPSAGFRVAVFVTDTNTNSPVLAGYAQPVAGSPGTFTFTFANDALSPDASYFISSRVEIIDPAQAQQAQGFGDFAQSLEIVVDTIAPTVFFGDPAVADDGVIPDGGVIPQPPFFDDNKINDQTPTFWGTAEANSIIRVYADLTPDNGVDNFDVLLGLTVALPYDGTNQYPNGQWQLESNIDLNDEDFFPVDGLRRILVTAEDLAGNINPGTGVTAQALNIFLDTQGPQITGVFHTETLLVGLSGTNTIVRFRSDAPDEILGTATVTLGANETLVGIDWRPLTQELYGLVNSAAGTDRLIKINPFTGVSTFTVNLSTNLTGTNFGVDFNPVADLLRVVSDTGVNIRINPTTGAVTTDAAINGATTNATAAAYTNNQAAAASTSLYVINTTTDQLFLQNPPNNGTTTLVGALGVDATAINGFDIAPGTNVAFAALIVGGNANLYRINLSTGAATLVGDIDANSNPSLNGLTALTPYDVFDPKPTTDGPTPLVNSLSIRVRDLPARVAAFLNPAVNPTVAVNPGHFLLVGDANGIIPIATVTFVSDPIVVGQPATGTLVLTFFSPLPDDRFTLTVSDSIVDDAGNALDGESNANQPQEIPFFPTGDGVPGGDFLARFTVDSRPEIGVTAAGSIYVDTNGNFGFDPYNLDYVNRDITYLLGFTSDNVFAGNFSPAGANQVADGFDKVAVYGRVGGSYRWLIDTDNNGVPNFATTQATSPNGLPVSGNFDGNVTNGDEVGLYTGTSWVLDLNHDFIAETVISTSLVGLPIVGDFNGDGFDDLATWSSDKFFIDFRSNYNTASSADLTFEFGFIGTREQPITADFDQDGIDDLGLWVPDRSGAVPSEQAEWYILVSNNQSIAARVTPAVGDPTRNVVNYTPTPFGKDMYASFGDDYALPLFGNFDPPLTESTVFETGPGFKNPTRGNDVNGDGNVTNLDAFLVISALRSGDDAVLPRLPAGALSGAPYVDTSGDNNLTNLDAFTVIGELRSQTGLGGEGETFATSSVTTLAASSSTSSSSTSLAPSLAATAATSTVAAPVMETTAASRSTLTVDSPEYVAALDSAFEQVMLAATSANSAGEYDTLALAVAEATTAEDTFDLLAADWLAPKNWENE